MRLSVRQKQILVALQSGSRLKVHRTVDGDKRYLLHAGDETQGPKTSPPPTWPTWNNTT